jgi:hypothetical protein
MGKFAILAQKAIFTEGVGSTSGFVQVGQTEYTSTFVFQFSFSSSRTLQIWLMNKTSAILQLSALVMGEMLFPNQHKALNVG